MNMNRIYQLMKLNRAIKSHRLKLAGILLLHILKLRYLCLRFDPIIACNLRGYGKKFSFQGYIGS